MGYTIRCLRPSGGPVPTPFFRVILSISFFFIHVLPVNAESPPALGNREPVLATQYSVDKIVIRKDRRVLEILAGEKKINEYRIALGANPVGPKRCEGDGKTPEGSYRIIGRNRQSAFHRSLRISYPNASDRENAKRLGCDPGGDIMIHGVSPAWSWVGKQHALRDWTLGCIAVSNDEIEQIWKVVPDGVRVEILP